MASNYLEDNWQSNKGVFERNKHMLEKELETDVVFKVSSPFEPLKVQTIRAHKYMLISASPVFWAMLCGQLQEDGDIIVPDVAPDAFQQMLRFIYIEHATITGKNVMQILHAAKKYQLSNLVKQCVDFLDKELNASNAYSILDHSQFFGEKQLMTKRLEKIEENTSDALNSDDFKSISKDTLGVILDSNKLSMEEVKIFERSYEWASYKTDKTKSVRAVLGNNLYKIRFPIMPSNSFTEIVCSKEILTDSEQLQIFKYLTSPKTSAKPAAFCCDPRQPVEKATKSNRTSPRKRTVYNERGRGDVGEWRSTDVKIRVGDRVRVLQGQYCDILNSYKCVYKDAGAQGTVQSLTESFVVVNLDSGETVSINMNYLEKLQ